MAKVINANPRSLNNKDGGYATLYGEKKISDYITKVQSAKISSGTELEHLIENSKNINLVENVDVFFDTIDECKDAVYLINKKYLRKATIFKGDGKEKDILVDFLVIEIKNNKRHCIILELKSGSSFDTKKVPAEKKSLEMFETRFSKKIQATTEIKLCSFFEENKKVIFSGLKGIFSMDEILTGKELCNLLKIEHDEILHHVNQDKKENDTFFYEFALQMLKERYGKEELIELISA